jgi:hypothetical protein
MRPALPCRCRKASFAAPAGRPIPRVGNAARIALSTRCGPARTARSASICSGRFRSSSSGRERRTNAAGEAVVALRGPRGDPSNSSGNADGMAARNGRRVAASSNRHVVASRSILLSSNRRRLREKESGPDAVAGGAAAVRAESPFRTRTPARRNRVRPASRVRPARRSRYPVRIPPSLARKAAPRVQRARVPSGGGVSGDVGAAVAAGRKAGRPRRRRRVWRRDGVADKEVSRPPEEASPPSQRRPGGHSKRFRRPS